MTAYYRSFPKLHIIFDNRIITNDHSGMDDTKITYSNLFTNLSLFGYMEDFPILVCIFLNFNSCKNLLIISFIYHNYKIY